MPLPVAGRTTRTGPGPAAAAIAGATRFSVAACEDEIRTCDPLKAFIMGRVEALRRLAGWNPEGTYSGDDAAVDQPHHPKLAVGDVPGSTKQEVRMQQVRRKEECRT